MSGWLVWLIDSSVLTSLYKNKISEITNSNLGEAKEHEIEALSFIIPK